MMTATEDPGRKLQLSYQLLFEKNPLAMWVYDCKTLRVLAVNEAAARQYGYSQSEVVALSLLDIHHVQADAQPWHDYLCTPATDMLVSRFWRHQNRNGNVLDVETVVQGIEQDGEQANLMLVRDMTEQRRHEQHERDLAQRLITTLESITDAFFTLDRDWCFTYVNAHAEALLQSSREELLGCNIWEKFPEAVGSTFQIEYERAVTQNLTASFESFYAPLGLWFAVDAYPSSQGLAVYFRDVSEKNLAQRQLIEERETLSAVLNSTTDAIICVGSDGLISMFNPGAERIFRRSFESMQGQTLDMLLPERFRGQHIQHVKRFASTGVSSRMMGLGLVKGLRSDGTELDLEGTISQVTVNGQKILIASLRDVTERVQADTASRQSHAHLSDLTQKLMTQEKALVKRLAMSLHDQLGQTMAAIRMVHETSLALRDKERSAQVLRLEQQMGDLIGQAIRQIRQVLTDLRPPLLEEQGLAAALDNELRNRSLAQPGVNISIEMKPEMSQMRWPAEVEYAAFMVAREALENVFRHAEASTLTVQLRGGGLSMQLDVIDDGVGIRHGDKSRTGHLGILGMHERAHAVGARVSVESGIGGARGTRVSFIWEPS